MSQPTRRYGWVPGGAAAADGAGGSRRFAPSAAAEVCPFGRRRRRAGVHVPFPAVGLAWGLRVVAPHGLPPAPAVTLARMQRLWPRASPLPGLSSP